MYGRVSLLGPRAVPLFTALFVSACPMLEPPPPQPRFGQMAYDGPVWCYRTLGAPECYAEEQPQFASRLIGSYVELPPPPPPRLAPSPSVDR